MRSIQVVYEMGGEIIDTKSVNESQLSLAMQYGFELSNQYLKEINVTIIEQMIARHIIKPTRRVIGNNVTPKQNESPSCKEFLGPSE